MSNFSIHLSETLSDADAKRVAQQTAPALGGNPEKLHLLLSKQPGSRIARASSQRQAETVAGILRNAGVKVEVLENATEAGFAAPAKPAVADPFATPSIPPLAPPKPDLFTAPAVPPANPTGMVVPANPTGTVVPPNPTGTVVPPNPTGASLPRLETASDPFAAFKTPDPFGNSPPKPDPFAVPASDPFAAPKSDPFAPPKAESVPAPKSDPFAAPASDPFAAPKAADPFAAPKSDPFAAPVLRNRDAEVSLNPDPFAAPGSAMVLDTKATQTDLPPQARRARDRAVPRTSVRNQLLRALIIPYIIVAVSTIGFVLYQLPQIYREELGARAYQAALGEAESNYELIAALPAPKAIQELQAEAKDDLDQIPEAVAIIYAANVMAISGSNGDLAAHASKLEMTAAEAAGLDTQFDEFADQGKLFGTVTFRGQTYIGAAVDVKEERGQSASQAIGDVHVMFGLDQIWGRVLQSLVPLFVALGLIFFGALFLANALAAGIARPIVAATEQANRISLGDLDRSVTIESNDEIGDMLGSLERMRVSLKSMVARLRRNT